MRTHILIATALLLSATTAHATSRSLSGAQANPVEAPAQKVQVLEAPAPKVQLLEAPTPKVQVLEAPQAAEQSGIGQRKDQSKDQFKAAEQTPPVETAPVRAAPIEAVANKPIETAPVVAAPAEASPAPAARPEARRKQQHRHVSIERRMEREFRTIGRKIERHIGFALSTGTLYHW